MRAVFLDKSKAFDRVLHCCLIVKLRSIGVEGNLFNWLISYLSCRKQRAIIKWAKRDKPLQPPLILNDSIIEDVTVHEHLGLTLSSNLSWRAHILKQFN